MEQATQETQVASQTYLQQHDEFVSDENCWGLLWPIISHGNPKPVRFNKDKRKYTIGRSSSCDLKIQSQIISNLHSTIEWDGTVGPKAGLFITDHSRNGTWVKGTRISKSSATLIHNGDEIAFGVPMANSTGESHRYTFRTPVSHVERKGIHVKYELQQELGRGSFATVHKALHRETGLFYAVKIIPKPQSLLQPQTVKMLEREMGILKRLDHPNIVALCDVVPSDVELCLVMELVSGGDLFEYIVNAGHLSEATSGRLTSQLCDAMAYIHYQGITHRDLKPENILLTTDDPPNVKVADFGLAKCVDSRTMLRTMCGTPSYLAPEVVLQDAQNVGYDHRVDSWSVGAIVFAMLTGQGAFREDENQPLSKRVKSRTVTWEYMEEVGCSEDAIDFVASLLQNNPEERISLADALRHAWLCPIFCPSGLPSYFHQQEGLMAADSPRSLVGSVMSAPTPLNGVSEDFQNLEIDNDSAAESPAYVEVNFEDANFGGPSDLTRSQLLRKNVEEREQSWDIVDDSGDPEQTPLARPRLQLLDEETTARARPPIVTNLPPPPPLQKRPKRKLSSDDRMTPGEASSSGNEPSIFRLGSRKASKVSQYDSPTTATRTRFPRKASMRNGKGPIERDFADGAE